MDFIFIILGTLMWSIDTLIRYPLLGQLRAETIVFLEHLFLVIIFVPGFVHGQNFRKLFSFKSLPPFIVIGVFGSALSTLAFTTAFSLINPSLVILLQKLQPVLVISLSNFILKENISRRFYLFALLAIIGGFMVSFPDLQPLLTSQSSDKGVLLGYFLTLLAVAGWAASTVYGKKLSLDGYSEREIMTGRFGLGLIALLIYCLFTQSLPDSGVTAHVYIKVFAMVLISGVLGMYFYYRGLKKLSAHVSSIAELFFPVSAILINWIFLNKTLLPVQIAGAALLGVASVALNRKKKELP